jgi:hypothetical protein
VSIFEKDQIVSLNENRALIGNKNCPRCLINVGRLVVGIEVDFDGIWME